MFQPLASSKFPSAFGINGYLAISGWMAVAVAAENPPVQSSPPGVKLQNVNVEAAVGKPLGAGSIELTFAEGHGPQLYPDQPLRLHCREHRIHYATFDLTHAPVQANSGSRVERIRINFLFRGDAPLQLIICGAGETIVDDLPVQPRMASDRRQSLLLEWWDEFSTLPDEIDPEQIALKRSLLDILSRHLDIPVPWPSGESSEGRVGADLEKQFERAIGMLFGIESVKLAMQQDVPLHTTIQPEVADQPLPAPPRMRSVPIPPVPAQTWVEPIAMHVPAECFYLRTGNLTNYRYFREFLLGWGGSLDDIVSTTSLDHQTRRTIETQLALEHDAIDAERLNPLISDMALIGCDPLFRQGAALGVLFRARDSRGLLKEIQSQRQRVKSTIPTATERREEVDRHVVSVMMSDDNRVRSFYAIDKEYHLITNSRYLLERFFEAGRGDRSLGALDEFRYARSKTSEHRNALAFLYLSDPFFRHLISPHYRIEITRRQRALQEIKQFRLAQLVAAAEQNENLSWKELLDARYLPPHFGKRPDGSSPLIQQGEIRDSLRGAPGVFMPVPDVSLTKATRSEVAEYTSFVRRYDQEWRRVVDPVTVVFSRHGAAGPELDRLGLEIMVTPYAKRKYALLERHLAPASTKRVAAQSDDLLSIDTAVQLGSGQPSHLLYLGLRDATLDFSIDDGQLSLKDHPAGATYAKRYAVAAISPPSTGVLRLLASLVGQRSLPSPPANARRLVGSGAVPTPPALLPDAWKAPYYMGWAVVNLTPKLSAYRTYTAAVENRGNWSVVSLNPEIREDVFRKLNVEWSDSPHQLNLRMSPLAGSQIEPYIQAHTYLRSRRVSGAAAGFLNDVAQWLHLPPAQARNQAERLLDARFDCPLGGDFRLKADNDDPHWVGTDWKEPSVFLVSSVPASWNFPFLDWLRRLDFRFDLDPTVLRASADITVRQNKRIGDGQPWDFLEMHDFDQPQAFDQPQPARQPLAMKSSPSGRWNASRTTAGPTRVSVPRGDRILGMDVAFRGQQIRVTRVLKNGPADRIGLRAGDQIRAVDQSAPQSIAHFHQLLEAAQRNGNVVLTVLRGSALVTFQVPL